MTDHELLRKAYAGRIAALQTALKIAKPNEYVHVWTDYGIGVQVNRYTGEAPWLRVVGVEQATIVKASDARTFNNGQGKPAILMPRIEAMQRALQDTRGFLAKL
jgi:hypothetical protein